MIPIKSLPDFDWTDIAKEEIELSGNDLISASDRAYRIRNICVAGLIYSNLLEPPWFWFALAKGVTLADLLDFRRLKEDIPQGALTSVKADDEQCLRFAKFYGFEDTGIIQIYKDVTFKVYRRL